MMDNDRRAELGITAIRAAASVTNVWRVELADTAIIDVLSYIAHACDRAGLDARETFAAGLESYQGDFEDGPAVAQWFDGTAQTFAEMKFWGE